jgi:putative aldouronate transport system substrate-binding protein
MLRGKKGIKLIVALTTVAMINMTLFTACSVSKSATQGSENGSKNEKPVEISIFTEFNTVEPPTNDNPVLKEFEKKTNTIIKIIWTSPNNYKDKTNVMLASGDMPDLMKVQDFSNPLMQDMAMKGAFWDLGPYLKNYKNLMEYPKEVYDKVKIDGKQYALPSVRPTEGASYLAIRKDWADKLNMKVPTTTDELYDLMYAFKYKDPDGNGKADTFGHSARGIWAIFDTFIGTSGSGAGKFKEVGGKLVNMELEPEAREAILFLNKMNTNKLMPEDWSVMKDSQGEDLAKGNKAGVSVDTVEGIFRSTAEAKKIDPNADFLSLASLKGPSGVYAPKAPGFGGMYFIPKTVKEDKVKKALELMDYGASEEGFTLACFGIKGVHYNVDADGFKTTTEQALKDSVSQSSFGKIFERYDKYLWGYRTGMDKATFERNKKIIDESAKVSIPDKTIGLISQTDLKLGADYAKKSTDLKTKVIMGIEPITAWDKYVEALKLDTNYMTIIDEYNKAFAAKKK